MLVDIIKIDVEGHELGVLKGAVETLRRSREIKVIIEWSPSQMREADIQPEEMIAFFHALEFSAFPVEAAEFNAGTRLRWDEVAGQPYANLLLTRI